MYEPVMRVFLLLEMLQGRDRVSGAELAERLEVDLRTVQRYVVRLKELGIPVGSSPGVGGAYRLRSGYRLPPMVLTNEEAFALSLGLRALRQVGLAAFAPATEGALAKLGRVLPESLRESLRTVEEVVMMEPSPWVAPASVECLMGAATAIRGGRRVGFAYEAHDGAETRREVEPYAVMHSDGRWYLMGWCLERKAVRTFRMDRVRGMEVGSETFERVEGFDARKYLAEQMPFVQTEFAVDVWIDMPVAEAEKHFALWRVAVEAEGDGTTLRCGRDRLELFAAMVLSLGRRVVVREPAELREVFRGIAERAAEAAQDVSTGEGGRT